MGPLNSRRIKMFKINYTFQKGGPVYSCRYPKPEDCNNNIFIFQGKNDQGKTTTMEMVALGLYGLESGDISNILKRRIKRLISDETEKCEFDFTIHSNDAKIRIDVNMKNKQIAVTINGDKKPRDYVLDNFKILFDTPEEPMKKLASSATAIKQNIITYDLYAQKYMNSLEFTLEQIESYEDSEKRLSNEKKELNDIETSLKNVIDRLNTVKANYIELNEAHVIIQCHDLADSLDQLNDTSNELEKRMKELKSKGAYGGNRKYYEKVDKFMNVLERLKLLLNMAQFDDISERKVSKIKKELHKIISVRDLSEKKLKLWYVFFDDLNEKLKLDPFYNKKLAEEKEIKLIDSLIPILKEYITLSIPMPGTKCATIGDFIKELEKTKNQLEDKISKKLILNNALDSCHDIIEYLGKLATLYVDLPKQDEQIDDDYETLDKRKKDLIKKMENTDRELAKLEDEYECIPEQKRRMLLYMRDRVESNYDNTKKDKENLEKEVAELERKKTMKKEMIEELKKIEKPKKIVNKNKLKSLHNNAAAIRRKLENFRKCIEKIDLEEMKVKEVDEEEQKFYTVLGDYFAEMLDILYFEHREWKLNRIDFINGYYIVEGRKSIGFSDIGTGHSALNSLLTRIKQDYGGKRKILLIDEIGNIDQDNVDILLKEIKNQIVDGKVILALLTKPNNTLNNVVVEPIRC